MDSLTTAAMEEMMEIEDSSSRCSMDTASAACSESEQDESMSAAPPAALFPDCAARLQTPQRTPVRRRRPRSTPPSSTSPPRRLECDSDADTDVEDDMGDDEGGEDDAEPAQVTPCASSSALMRPPSPMSPVSPYRPAPSRPRARALALRTSVCDMSEIFSKMPGVPESDGRVRRSQSFTFTSPQKTKELPKPVALESAALSARAQTKPRIVEGQDLLPTLEERGGSSMSVKKLHSHTLAALIRGEFSHKVRKYYIVDCRYEYEYDGGHIKGAINIPEKGQTEAALRQLFFDGPQAPASTSDVVLIFHCEFSMIRGPTTIQILRTLDRSQDPLNVDKLRYPHVYLLSGGYKDFYEHHRELCDPCDYVRMDSREHLGEQKIISKQRRECRASSALLLAAHGRVRSDSSANYGHSAADASATAAAPSASAAGSSAVPPERVRRQAKKCATRQSPVRRTSSSECGGRALFGTPLGRQAARVSPLMERADACLPLEPIEFHPPPLPVSPEPPSDADQENVVPHGQAPLFRSQSSFAGFREPLQQLQEKAAFAAAPLPLTDPVKPRNPAHTAVWPVTPRLCVSPPPPLPAHPAPLNI
eukprot:m51a1_g4332 putative m-phase inducer phosphatase (592) ;mRNA; f:143129-145449